jgi:hypothetical protein
MSVATKLINLNSSNAIKLNGDFLSNVYFSFKGLLTDDSTIKRVSVAVQDAQFPYSFYNINIYNNLLRISDNGDPPVVLTLTRGNYNANSLITEIQAQLLNAGINHWSISISSITGLLTFTCQNNHSFTLFSSGSTCFKVLGLDPSTDYTSVGGTLTAPYPLNLLGTLKLRIASYELSTSSIDSTVAGNLNILASIPINTGNFGLIMYENKTNVANELNTKILDGFDLEILDDDGNFVNFNNAYWTISLLIMIERDFANNLTFNQIVQKSMQNTLEDPPVTSLKDSLGANEEKDTNNANDETYVEPVILEDTIEADDLDLLLYSRGIR